MLTDYGKDREENNHFEALIPKDSFNKDKNKLQKIRELLCDIDPKCQNKVEEIKNKANKVISGRKGKSLMSRKGESIWNLYIPITSRNKTKDSFLKYKVEKLNKDLNEKVDYRIETKYIIFSEIIKLFNKDNIVNNGINDIIDNFNNIFIDKIKNKIITNKEMNSIMNVNDELAKRFSNCICYECSGLNGNKKKTYRIYNSLYELKNHCRDKHNGSFDKCNINYRLVPGFVEIEIEKNAYRYIIHADDLLKDDKIDYTKYKRGGNNSYNVKIYGENIRTISEMNRGLLSNVLDNNRPDFMLLNGSNIGKIAFNMSVYKLELPDKLSPHTKYSKLGYYN